MSTGSASEFEGGCACGAVRFRARVAPKRAGLCHCRVCQQVHGSAFNAFVVFDHEHVEIAGDTVPWESSPGYVRLACAECGSRLGALNGTETELSLLLFDAHERIVPHYESWVSRRVTWLPALAVTQYEENRIAPYGQASQ